jgi:hypothetical protein
VFDGGAGMERMIAWKRFGLDPELMAIVFMK